jgi:hypothetical protein
LSKQICAPQKVGRLFAPSRLASQATDISRLDLDAGSWPKTTTSKAGVTPSSGRYSSRSAVVSSAASTWRVCSPARKMTMDSFAVSAVAPTTISLIDMVAGGCLDLVLADWKTETHDDLCRLFCTSCRMQGRISRNRALDV